MTTARPEPQVIWNTLCGNQVSPKEHPFKTQQEAQDYLNDIIREEGIESLKVPPFDAMSLEELAEIIWKFQWNFKEHKI